MRLMRRLLVMTLISLAGCASPPNPESPPAAATAPTQSTQLAAPESATDKDGKCGGFEALELGQPVRLLNGRLKLRAPAGAQESALSPDIMSAPNAASTETRLVVDIGGARLVVMTHAFLATETEKLEASKLRRDASLVEYGPVESKQGFQQLTGTYRRLAPKGDTVFVATALTKLADNTLQETLFAVNDVAFKAGVGGCKAMAKRVLASLEIGPNQLDLAERDIDIEGGKYSLHVPAGYVYYPQPGPDFTVYRLQELSAVGSDAAVAGAYFGHFASFRPESTAKKLPGKVLGQAVTWFETQDSDGIGRETLVKQGEEQIHLFLGAQDAAHAEALTKALSSLKRKPAKP